jgi:hypothetical protein
MKAKKIYFESYLHYTTILLVVVGLISNGCSTSAIFWDGHRAYPKKPCFTIMPREYSEEELEAANIRTDGVYVYIGLRPQEVQEQQETMMKENSWETGSPYYRFWANGRFLFRTENIDPENLMNIHADSFERARMGYFRICNDKSIEEEVYVFHPGKRDYGYFKSRFKIEHDTVWFDASGGQKHKGETIQIGYRFVPITEMKAQPDW